MIIPIPVEHAHTDQLKEDIVRVKQPDDLLVFRGCRATRDVLEGVERRGGRVGVEVLAKGVRGYCSIVRAEEVLE